MKNNQQRTAPLNYITYAHSTEGHPPTEELDVTTLGRENSELKVCVKPVSKLSHVCLTAE